MRQGSGQHHSPGECRSQSCNRGGDPGGPGLQEGVRTLWGQWIATVPTVHRWHRSEAADHRRVTRGPDHRQAASGRCGTTPTRKLVGCFTVGVLTATTGDRILLGTVKPTPRPTPVQPHSTDPNLWKAIDADCLQRGVRRWYIDTGRWAGKLTGIEWDLCRFAMQ